MSTRTQALLSGTLLPKEGIKKIKMQLEHKVTPAPGASEGDGLLEKRSSYSPGCVTGEMPEGN